MNSSLYVPLFTTPPKSKKRIRIVAISDTHTKHNLIDHLPSADILLHCGDFAHRCKTEDHIKKFNEWLGTLKQYRYKIVIAGNQEYIFNKMTRDEIQKRLLTNCIYLQDSECTVEGIRIYGSPVSDYLVKCSSLIVAIQS
jgi:predicted MPP superfamily phosphohydrolase